MERPFKTCRGPRRQSLITSSGGLPDSALQRSGKQLPVAAEEAAVEASADGETERPSGAARRHGILAHVMPSRRRKLSKLIQLYTQLYTRERGGDCFF